MLSRPTLRLDVMVGERAYQAKVARGSRVGSGYSPHLGDSSMGQIDEAGDVAKYLHGEIMAMKALIAAAVKVAIPKPLFERAALEELQLLRDAFEPNPKAAIQLRAVEMTQAWLLDFTRDSAQAREGDRRN